MIMCQSITAIFLVVAVIAACLPFPNAIFLKNLPKSESFKLPTALAAFHNDILSLLLPFGILFDKILHPLTLLFGANLKQEKNFFADEDFFIPTGPNSLIKVKTVL